MQFKEVIGNEELKVRLMKMADSGRTSHSMMFIEQDGCGALAMVLAFVQYLSCPDKIPGVDSCGVCPTCRKIAALQHQDLHFVFPVNATANAGSSKKPVSDTFISEWRELFTGNHYFTERNLYAKLGIEDKVGIISVLESKNILDKLSLKSYEGFNKYMVIWLPERMNAEAANRLLKIVEEPSPDTYFLFVTHAPENVLNTIRSRTLPIRMYPAEVADVAQVLQSRRRFSFEEAVAFAKTALGSIGTAMDMAGSDSEYSIYAPVLLKMLDFACAKDLVSLLSVNDEIAKIKWGREKQKSFCVYSTGFLRKAMMVSIGMQDIAAIQPDEKQDVERIAAKLPFGFYEKALTAFDNARSDIESNVNAKIVFCNLANVMYVTLNPFKK